MGRHLDPLIGMKVTLYPHSLVVLDYTISKAKLKVIQSRKLSIHHTLVKVLAAATEGKDHPVSRWQ